MKIYSQGDQAIVVSIEKNVSQRLTEDLLSLRAYLIDKSYPFITEIVATESDLMICYDARDMIKHHHIQSPFLYMKALIDSIKLEIRHHRQQLQAKYIQKQQSVNIPVIYGGEFGPDLQHLLKHLKLKLEDFVKLHTQEKYFVSMMGYSPGFPYLTGMNKKLHVNHTSKKKKFIPCGSVIIEGEKCGIVTTDTYNDWLVIGYTPVQLFFPEQQNFTLLKLGDNVTFESKGINEIELGDYKICQS
ncbi:allophanate hydrolase subunit 1 [Staphylococcus epidermidis]|uniref:5-oxoprolinase subunit B family protein n=1 Tax=Staphylococcus TaxID=1279 RepID=UPI0001F48FBC|nr:allophanate hydrolase subunit 1 [Staphylococcus epidermidis]EFV89425.1 allophanate hydrolase subunit 1 family protein [Staphylococcus epidermidis FRI909]MCG2495050.1 allophanate hydrolase subunit 1 [Staphylococcus epidermidis]MCG2517670.1 allophanate hydrolase subunit 1 [Staphylococcus epidermidis]MCO6332196.1 allophanate hydrolase subunit 1 [Staphylococcus epidermidis]